MDEHERRIDKVGDVVAAYSALKTLFNDFISGWQDTDKKVGVLAKKARGDDFSLSLFDGKEAKILFTMVLNQRGDPWGKIAFIVEDKAVSVIYFDPRGYLYDQPRQNSDGQVPPLLKHPCQQSVLVARFMEKYLETFHEDERRCQA